MEVVNVFECCVEIGLHKFSRCLQVIFMKFMDEMCMMQSMMLLRCMYDECLCNVNAGMVS